MRYTNPKPSPRRSEAFGLLLIGISSLLILALLTDGNRGFSERPMDSVSANRLGMPGAFAAQILTMCFGHASHALYCITFIWGCMLLIHLPLDRLATRLLGAAILLGAIAGLLHMDLPEHWGGRLPGGALGSFVASWVSPSFGAIGANVIMVMLSLVGLLLATEFLFVRFFLFARWMLRTIGRIAFSVLFVRQPIDENGESASSNVSLPEQVELFDESQIESTRRKGATASIRVRTQEGDYELAESGELALRRKGAKNAAPVDDVPETDDEADAAADSARIEKLVAPVIRSSVNPAAKPKRGAGLRRRMFSEEELPADYVYPKRYTRPSLELFDLVPKAPVIDLRENLMRTSQMIEETLKTFGIEARVTDITRGPTLTRFELEPAPGIKVNRFTSLTDDIALALKAHGVRVEAPIPGKGRVGIEVPNVEREPVVIRELIESRTFVKHRGALKLALGKDIAGDVYSADLATMPHLLVAGATGAGKTVCVKALLASLLLAKTPEEMQLMLIDPKMVELSIFNDIPHLITPVVTDPKKAASTLNWLINEMEERYRLFAHLRVRNIEVYNESVENGEIEVDENEGGETNSMNLIRKLPYIVCVIDELADLMMLARAEVEDAIARLAQLARAVGIHLILATQRPSVDVLTGVIKANFPARMSFQVSSRVDSRCILDEIGAERLIGRGDMLYLPAGQSKPVRIQCAFVSDDEMNRLIAYLKTQAPPQYRDEIEKFGKKESAAELECDESDELLDDAVQIVLETGQASISMVQRRLRVGYTRAARLIDMMEMKGIVGPHLGSKAREILVDYTRKGEAV
jgi:S-DNA-T family DNA segregation ATPase FtsK/SpoIIIE